ncbi:uracil-DNA glycosylase family protein [Geoalkalibacter halelectricus]|uniref:Single-stranded DNA-binding protein n=1 Tax=Geoalkalibacter halelectricus TaxID=2847045 RepID=A0ABY5ZW03_9BACT|nr:uracil-DNA glycosylase family protein [Geoalkalibacter halelectricus]MDO3376667.1 single-stranded DNA-binding protein [Geoalkalibacter halelectricus]UWZ81381.1 single-stranded DNA-binding protein [Geoalkalibacter halelectricus]
MRLWDIQRRLAADLDRLVFADPVRHVYNPLGYADAAHREYLERYGAQPKEVVFLGMNPGPWGMAQTGVPFGEVTLVRDWLGIERPVARPAFEHPKKPVTGFACRRSEVSGRRLWGLFREIFGTPENFFRRYFVLNYCPLLFLEESGRNRTPDQLPVAEREALMRLCDEALRATLDCLGTRHLIGVGGYAAQRAGEALAGSGIKVGRILHPSPASPAANRDWAGQARVQLAAQGVILEAG